MCKHRDNRIHSLILLMLIVWSNAEAKARDVEGHLADASVFYWLSRVRNNSRVEMERCRKHYRLARTLSQDDQVIATAKEGEDLADAEIRYGRFFLENYMPVLRLLSSQDDVLVRYDLEGRVAVQRALEHLLSDHPLLWHGTMYILVSCESSLDNSP